MGDRADASKIKQFEESRADMITEVEDLRARITRLEKEAEENRRSMQQTKEEKEAEIALVVT